MCKASELDVNRPRVLKTRADHAVARAQEPAHAARRQLAVFPASPEREALEALADFVLHRDR